MRLWLLWGLWLGCGCFAAAACSDRCYALRLRKWLSLFETAAYEFRVPDLSLVLLSRSLQTLRLPQLTNLADAEYFDTIPLLTRLTNLIELRLHRLDESVLALSALTTLQRLSFTRSDMALGCVWTLAQTLRELRYLRFFCIVNPAPDNWRAGDARSCRRGLPQWPPVEQNALSAPSLIVCGKDQITEFILRVEKEGMVLASVL